MQFDQQYTVCGKEDEDFDHPSALMHPSALLKAGLIRRSMSPWSVEVVMVKKPKKANSLCFNYKPPNAITIKDCFPILRTDDITEILSFLHHQTQQSVIINLSWMKNQKKKQLSQPKLGTMNHTGYYSD